MTNTFTNDNGNNGTPEFTAEQQADNAAATSENPATNIQQQIDVMQKRLGDKDEFIGTLQSENQTLREKMADIEARLEAFGNVDDALARMEQAKDSNQDTTLDEEQLVSKVLNKMEQKTKEEMAEANFKEVSATLTKKFGKDKVDEIVKKAAEESGLSFDDMFDLAKRSPKAVYRMVGINVTTTGNTPSPSPQSTIGFNDENKSREEKLAYFSKLRRENPKEYYKPEVQKKFREVCLSK